MVQAGTAVATDTARAAGAARAFLELCKPKVVALIVFTAVVGMLLASPGLVPLLPLIAGTIGIAACAASAAALNHLVERRIDARMTRTRHRPIVTGRIDAAQALTFAVLLGIGGLAILALWVNVLTAALTFATQVGYAGIYTGLLKRATPQNIVIGGAAGAAPPVLGWTAVTGSVDPHSLLLFLIVFVWTPPHFWALAIHRHEDYAQVDMPMLPVTHGVDFTRWHILGYTVLLLLVTLLPYLTGMCGAFYLGGALALGLGFVYYAIELLRRRDDRQLPMTVFGFSIVYLMALFAFLLVDHYLPRVILPIG